VFENKVLGKVFNLVSGRKGRYLTRKVAGTGDLLGFSSSPV
jgi:hypothetical protein